MASQNPSSVPVVLPNALPPLNNAINNNTPQWLPYSAGAGVTQITAGAGIAVSPAGGTGNVTVSASPFIQGMIMMYDKTSAFPPGWFICDGAVHNGYTTPTLLDKFVLSVGPSNPTVGLGGGAASTVLTLNMIPDHTHGGVGLDTHSGVDASPAYSYASTASNTTGISNAGYTAGTPVPTLPPYVTYAYICYCGIAP